MKALHQIEIIKITPLPRGSALRAFASVLLHRGIVINDIRIIEQFGKSPWCSMPQRESVVDGKKKYYPVVEIRDRDLRSAIEEKVLEGYRACDTGEVL